MKINSTSNYFETYGVYIYKEGKFGTAFGITISNKC